MKSQQSGIELVTRPACYQTKGKNMYYNKLDSPSKIAAQGRYRHIPIMFGANSHEGTFVYDRKHKNS